MTRFMVAFAMVCLLGLGASPVALAESPSPSFAPPGPPYPEPLEGISVYDQAGVMSVETMAALKATMAGLESLTGLGVVVYTQVKPESDTSEEAAADAAALADQWGLGADLIGDDLVILLDLTPDRCHGQVRRRPPQDLPLAYLGDEELQGILDQEMLPPLAGLRYRWCPAGGNGGDRDRERLLRGFLIRAIRRDALDGARSCPGGDGRLMLTHAPRWWRSDGASAGTEALVSTCTVVIISGGAA